jgi:hypothetical protein
MNHADQYASAGLFGDLDELAPEGPLFWPDIAAGEAAAEWEELRTWVHRLVARYDLDSHVMPACWYRHNHLVEALVALRDYERGSFSVTAPPTAAVDWQRAWRDIETRLRAWTAELRCDGRHHPDHDARRVMPDGDWKAWVAIQS